MPQSAPDRRATANHRKAVIGNCELHLGDAAEILSNIAAADAIVTDPPYGMRFMAKRWDYDVPCAAIWKKSLNALKPGGHLVAFFGPRTYHRGVVQIEDAGFEVRDQIMWVYGSGFPKSHNLHGKWQGWGTALKPAHEPIVVARRLPSEATVLHNVILHQTGALNIDASRIPINETVARFPPGKSGLGKKGIYGASSREQGANSPTRYDTRGRWPANLIHDGSPEVMALFPHAKAGGNVNGSESAAPTKNVYGAYARTSWESHADSGSAGRFFYCAKANKQDRDEGLGELPPRQYSHDGRKTPIENAYQRNNSIARNHHPTVKPTDLMQYLCRLVTPRGGIILDPFMGSGSTGKAAVKEGFGFIGIEREPEYFEIACARIADAHKQANLFRP
jgi:DNA modification methylase